MKKNTCKRFSHRVGVCILYDMTPEYEDEKQCLENILGNETATIMFGVHDTWKTKVSLDRV